MSGKRPHAFIITIRRKPDGAPEGYYVTAGSPDQAKHRALRLAKARKGEIIDVIAA